MDAKFPTRRPDIVCTAWRNIATGRVFETTNGSLAELRAIQSVGRGEPAHPRGGVEWIKSETIPQWAGPRGEMQPGDVYEWPDGRNVTVVTPDGESETHPVGAISRDGGMSLEPVSGGHRLVRGVWEPR